MGRRVANEHIRVPVGVSGDEVARRRAENNELSVAADFGSDKGAVSVA